MTRKLRYGIAGILAAAAGAVAYVKLFRSPSLADLAKQVVECKYSADAKCLDEFVTSRERTVYGLSPSGFEKLVNDYYRPEVTGRRRLGGIETSFEPSMDRADAKLTYVGPAGSAQTISAFVVKTAEGPKCPNLIATLFLEAGRFRNLETGSRPLKVRNMEALARAAKQDAKLLESYGMSGLWIKDREGEGFRTWAELEASFSERAKLLAESAPSAPGDDGPGSENGK